MLVIILCGVSAAQMVVKDACLAWLWPCRAFLFRWAFASAAALVLEMSESLVSSFSFYFILLGASSVERVLLALAGSALDRHTNIGGHVWKGISQNLKISPCLLSISVQSVNKD